MPKLVIIYGTGMRNTELVAKAIEEGARVEGVETLLKNVNDAEKNDLLDADAVAIGSPNYNNAMMPTVKQFLEALTDIDLSGKVGLAFGSYGWSFEATDEINKIMTSYGLNMMTDLCIKRMPDEKKLEECRRAGSELTKKMKNKNI